MALSIGGSKASVDERIAAVFAACAGDAGQRRQIGYLLGRHRVNYVTGDDGEEESGMGRPAP